MGNSPVKLQKGGDKPIHPDLDSLGPKSISQQVS